MQGANLDLGPLEVAGVAPGGLIEELRGAVELGDSPVGTLSARWSGALADYAATLDVDGRLDADGLQAFFVAQAAEAGADGAPPISATGAVVYADQRLEAGVSVADLALPILERPLRLGLTAQGTLDDLQLTGTVENERPLMLDVAALRPGGALALSDPLDVRGSATGRLRDGVVTGVQGRFGPVNLSGRVDLAPLNAQLDLSVDPLTLRVGGASGSVPAERGRADAEDAGAPGADPETADSDSTAPGAPRQSPVSEIGRAHV